MQWPVFPRPLQPTSIPRCRAYCAHIPPGLRNVGVLSLWGIQAPVGRLLPARLCRQRSDLGLRLVETFSYLFNFVMDKMWRRLLYFYGYFSTPIGRHWRSPPASLATTVSWCNSLNFRAYEAPHCPMRILGDKIFLLREGGQGDYNYDQFFEAAGTKIHTSGGWP